MPNLVSGAAVGGERDDWMKWSALLGERFSEHGSLGDPEIGGICYDSRRVERGDLFAALVGTRSDGHSHVPEALRRGAVALLLQRPVEAPVPQLVAPDSRRVLAQLAARFYGDPTRTLRVFGVTGTNGKTTITYLLESILQVAGRSVGVVGTVDYRFEGERRAAPLTTPEGADLQKLFAEMLQQGVRDVVMEVSSHALDQGRVAAIHFDAAAFTNLSRDHLDYHQDMETYFAAKRKFFTEFLPGSQKQARFAVINMEDPRGEGLTHDCAGRVLRTGLSGGYEITGEKFELNDSGIQAQLRVEGKRVPIQSSLFGRFNLENILVAVGLAHGVGIPLDVISMGVGRLQRVPGRLEGIRSTRGFRVFIDYAHTPEALENVGRTLRSFKPRRILTVFGCGGDRDSGKRSAMGGEAAGFSDLLVVTSDNPRTEDPEKIMDQILEGIRGANFPVGAVLRVPDRREAIGEALARAERGDLVLIAGKGHEDTQIIGTKRFPFSDTQVVREFLKDEVDDR